MRRTGVSRTCAALALAAAIAAACAAAVPSPGCRAARPDYAELRRRMVAEQIAARGIRDGRVIAAMAKVPRHRFVPASLRGEAYADYPLPIGEGQTISQPYIVALMTESLGSGRLGNVLEIGTGSGYQAAILAEIADSVFTIEIIPALARRAASLLDTLGLRNVSVRAGDGFFGWPAHAPFDGIIVTAAAPRVPEPLVAQLRTGARLVIPVGNDWGQDLLVYVKETAGLRILETVPVRFVPMTGKVRER